MKPATELPQNTEVYTTADLFLSAYLQNLGHKIISFKREHGRGFFTFNSTDQLEEDVLKWGNNEPITIRLRSFLNSTRDLKGMIGM